MIGLMIIRKLHNFRSTVLFWTFINDHDLLDHSGNMSDSHDWVNDNPEITQFPHYISIFVWTFVINQFGPKIPFS
jgi:hypothetical protein